MTYIDYLNDFNHWIETDSPPDKVIILYYGLLSTFNQRRWPRWAGVDTQRLMVLARTSDKKTALRARDVLVRAGFIEYKRGKKGKATEYRLLEYGGKFLPESATGNATPAPPSEARAAVAEYLTDRGIDKSLYFGVTDEVMTQAEQIAKEIFSKFTTKEPVESDVAKVFDYTHEREGVREETRIFFSEERIKLLAYAFEQAADIGKPGNWRYITAVMEKLGQRDIKTVEQAYDYDLERERKKGRY